MELQVIGTTCVRKNCFSKRQQEGGGIVIWAAFSSKEKATIVVCLQRMNSQNYQGVLEEHLLSFWLHPDHILYTYDHKFIHILQHIS